MIYKGLKRIFSYAVRQYFADVQVLNKENIPLDKPCLILPNHRSAFMDPIVISTLLKPEMNFLARGESFTNKNLNKVFTALNMIPIYRKEYSPTEVHKNDDVFGYCYDLLERRGALMIFPEGLCQTQFILAPLKTGTARIALGADDKNDFNLDVHLIPIGINYTNPHRFRSRLVIDIGKPIRTADYEEEYKKDPVKTVRDLTADIEKELKDLIITLFDVNDSKLIRRTEKLFEDQLTEEVESNYNWYEMRKFIAGGINYFRKHKPDEVNKLDKRIQRYISSAGNLYPSMSSSGDVADRLPIKNKWLKSIIMFVTFPLFITGLITHLIPFLLTRYLSLAMVKRTDFTGSVLLALGLLIFTIFGLGETYLVFKLTNSSLIAIAFALIWSSLGLFTYMYFTTARLYMQKIVSKFTIKNRDNLISYLSSEREEIREVLSNAYAEYRMEDSVKT